MTEQEKFDLWLENDWFTSGETSWEEYYNDETSESEAQHNG